jgi:hypothetical protein
MRKIAISAALLSLVIGFEPAVAQTAAPAPAPAPAASAPPAATPAGTDNKKAISKSCSDQATAKGLHGKVRKKFMSACKKNGGKAS